MLEKKLRVHYEGEKGKKENQEFDKKLREAPRIFFNKITMTIKPS